MKNLKSLIKEAIQGYEKPKSCSCGCNSCGDKAKMSLTEGVVVSEGLQYHIDNNIPLNENVYRIGSKQYFHVINEARLRYELGELQVDEATQWLLENTEVGTFGIFEGEKVPLDMPMLNTEAEYQGREVKLNKPKRGGSKAYYVYVKNPKTGKIQKVQFGSGGLKAKIRNKDARNAFAKRHNCSNKKDRTSPGYWSCNLPRYASALGLGANMNTFW